MSNRVRGKEGRPVGDRGRVHVQDWEQEQSRELWPAANSHTLSIFPQL